MDAILNFATEFFEMLTKKQSEHSQKVFQVFQVFRVFQVFHFAFGPQNRPVLVQIRTNPKNRYPPTSAIKWVRKTPKKAIHPLVYEHDPVLQAIGVVFFGEADFLFGRRRANLPSEKAKRGVNQPSEMAILGSMGANYCTHTVRLQYSGRLWVRTHHTPKHIPTYGRALCVGVFLNERAVPPYTVGKEMPQSWR